MTARSIPDRLARDAYLYGYSMDEAYKFLYETTIEPGVPLNRFQQMRRVADDTYTAHPTINNDTLHVMGWLDVAAEPVIVTVPDGDPGRYWILHTMDLGHYTNAMIGSRTRGAAGGRFMFAARAWTGVVPDGIDEVVRSESNLIKLMGRIMAVDVPGDLELALRHMDGWRLETLAAHLGEEGPRPKERSFPDPAATNWMERVNFVLADGSMADADHRWLEQYAEVGLGPGVREFTDDQLDAAGRGERLGSAHLAEIAPHLGTQAARALGTREVLQDGARDVFAAGTLLGQWGLPPVESVYVMANRGSDGLPVNGSHGKRYRLRFRAPDVSQFWSFTVYGSDDRLMAHNALNRHSRGDRTLTPNADGDYEIVLSADAQAEAANPNLLPIPEKDAYLILRMYGPSVTIQNGGYAMPSIDVAVD